MVINEDEIWRTNSRLPRVGDVVLSNGKRMLVIDGPLEGSHDIPAVCGERAIQRAELFL